MFEIKEYNSIDNLLILPLMGLSCLLLLYNHHSCETRASTNLMLWTYEKYVPSAFQCFFYVVCWVNIYKKKYKCSFNTKKQKNKGRKCCSWFFIKSIQYHSVRRKKKDRKMYKFFMIAINWKILWMCWKES